jgi:hypothetical protein
MASPKGIRERRRQKSTGCCMGEGIGSIDKRGTPINLDYLRVLTTR